MAANPAPVVFELRPGVDPFWLGRGRAAWVAQPAYISPVDVNKRIAQRGPAGAGRWLNECLVAQRADRFVELAPGVIGESEQLFDARAVHDDCLRSGPPSCRVGDHVA